MYCEMFSNVPDIRVIGLMGTKVISMSTRNNWREQLRSLLLTWLVNVICDMGRVGMWGIAIFNYTKPWEILELDLHIKVLIHTK